MSRVSRKRLSPEPCIAQWRKPVAILDLGSTARCGAALDSGVSTGFWCPFLEPGQSWAAGHRATASCEGEAATAPATRSRTERTERPAELLEGLRAVVLVVLVVVVMLKLPKTCRSSRGTLHRMAH
ncbi:unnamed protein product [Symbiodinium natans]|uniref:Uncharacterized protein n=1 Tax=Symbiodinium natans TaxID=878477 RepID=A0A812GSG4_9DINO|nr:unnamed protein product [Symbiodinium natans]